MNKKKALEVLETLKDYVNENWDEEYREDIDSVNAMYKFVVATLSATNIVGKAPELTEMTVESNGLFLEYSDGENFFTHWIPSEDLEKAGLINPANIVDWNTDGTELAFMTEIGYEWYSYKSKDVYKNRAFVPVKR